MEVIISNPLMQKKEKMVKTIIVLLSSLFLALSFTSCDDKEFENYSKDEIDVPFAILEGSTDMAEYPLELADNKTASDWMSLLDNKRRVCKVSIPGTHDALTGMGFYNKTLRPIFNMTAISQVSTLDDQLEHGLRFFDIRPVVCTDTITHQKVLRCTHGFSDLEVSFEDALDILADFLQEHPQEFVVVKIQHDNGSENQMRWLPMMKDFLSEYNQEIHPGIFATWRPDITVGEVRGKILFINRVSYDGMFGACCEWPDEDPDVDENVYIDEECSRVIYSPDYTLSTTMYVQDYYKTTNAKRQLTKKEAVVNMMQATNQIKDEDNTWVVNHCSAYTQVSPRGYVTNAEAVHPEAIKFLLEHPNAHVGIMAIDFACWDYVSVIINGGNPYSSDYLYDKKPMSQSLTNLIIMTNFKK